MHTFWFYNNKSDLKNVNASIFSGCNLKLVLVPATFLISKAVYCLLSIGLIAQVSKLPTDTKDVKLTISNFIARDK